MIRLLRLATREPSRAEAFRNRLPAHLDDLRDEIDRRIDDLEPMEVDGVVQVVDHDTVLDIRDWIVAELDELAGRRATLK